MEDQTTYNNLAPETLPALPNEIDSFTLPLADYVPGQQLPGKTSGLQKAGGKYVRWNFDADDNQFPRKAFELIYADKDAPQIIQRLVYFALGKGELQLFKRNPDGTPQMVSIPEIDQWKRKNRRKLANFLWQIATNFFTYGNYFAEYVLSKGDKTIADFNCIDCHYVRAEKNYSNTGITNYFIANFDAITDTQTYSSFTNTIPAYDESNPKKYAKFMLHGKIPTPGNPYYGIPVWVGGVEQMLLRKRITEYYSRGLDNGFNVKYLIKIHPEFYKGCKTQEERDDKKAALVGALNDALTGAKNANRTVAVDMVVDHQIKQLNGVVEIEPIANNLSDSSYNNILQQTNGNVPANFGINSLLAGIERANQLSSGSEVLNQYNVHLAVNVPQPRMLILQAIELIFEVNGWAEKYATKYDYLGFEDIQLKMQEENKMGTEPLNM